MSNLTRLITQEEREAAATTRAANHAKAKVTYNQHLPEDSLWQSLAKKHNVKLARSTKAPTPVGLKKFANELGYTDGEWQTVLFGHEGLTLSVSKAIKLQNERKGEGKWESLRELQGYLLEAL